MVRLRLQCPFCDYCTKKHTFLTIFRIFLVSDCRDEGLSTIFTFSYPSRNRTSEKEPCKSICLPSRGKYSDIYESLCSAELVILLVSSKPKRQFVSFFKTNKKRSNNFLNKVRPVEVLCLKRTKIATHFNQKLRFRLVPFKIAACPDGLPRWRHVRMGPFY